MPPGIGYPPFGMANLGLGMSPEIGLVGPHSSMTPRLPSSVSMQGQPPSRAMPGGGMFGGIMGMLQNPMIQELLGMNQQAPPPMQLPGLLMPQVSITPFQPTPVSGLLGGL